MDWKSYVDGDGDDNGDGDDDGVGDDDNDDDDDDDDDDDGDGEAQAVPGSDVGHRWPQSFLPLTPPATGPQDYRSVGPIEQDL